MKSFEPLDHPSDIGLLAYGRTMAEAFAHAAMGMFSLTADLDHFSASERFSIETKAENREALLVAWLSELLYIYDTKHIVFKEFGIESISDTKIKAEAFGEKIDLRRHQINKNMKAVTYSQLLVAEENGQWKVRVIFDV